MQAFITVGMGFGDEGKGATVDFLCRQFNANLVVRYSGGCQCAHNVINPDNERHPFAQFGSGTFTGARTHLASPVIIDPVAMRREASVLEKHIGHWPYELLTVDPECLVTTPLAKWANHNLQPESHGTCGMGIGFTREYWLKHGYESILAQDLSNRRVLLEKLNLMSQRIGNGVRLLPLMDIANELCESSRRIRFDNYPYIREYETVVFEGAQGILLDQFHGFAPHTTWSDVTPRWARYLCNLWDIKDITTIGVTRTFHTRHGRGPLPNETLLQADLLSDPGNPHNQWQGQMRFAPFNIDLFERAFHAVNETSKIDYLAVNHYDLVPDFELIDEQQFPPIGIYGYGPAHTDRKCLIKR